MIMKTYPKLSCSMARTTRYIVSDSISRACSLAFWKYSVFDVITSLMCIETSYRNLHMSMEPCACYRRLVTVGQTTLAVLPFADVVSLTVAGCTSAFLHAESAFAVSAVQVEWVTLPYR
jgi:hypothetical protein